MCNYIYIYICMKVYRSAQHPRLQSPVSSDKISKFTSFHWGSLGQNRAQHVMMATMEKPQQDNAKQHLRLPHRLTCWVCQRGYTTQLFNLSRHFGKILGNMVIDHQIRGVRYSNLKQPNICGHISMKHHSFTLGTISGNPATKTYTLSI